MAPRYSDDVGYDVRYPAMVARRALASDDYIHNAVDTSFALELLADRGIAVPGWNETAEPPPAPRRVEEPAEIARTISREGLSIVQAGFDAAGRLVRVSTVGGRIQVPVREPDEVMREERFKLWAAKYPYRYGVDDSTANSFYTTTANLRVSGLLRGQSSLPRPLASRLSRRTCSMSTRSLLDGRAQLQPFRPSHGFRPLVRSD